MSRQAPRQSRLPKNYKAERRHLNSAFKSIRYGQDPSQFLVLDKDVLSLCDPVLIRPLRAVQKENVSAEIEVLVIHDLSFNNGSANNNFSLHGRLPSIEYRQVAAVARKFEECHCRYSSTTICILKGVLCHLMVASRHIRWVAASILERETLVFDLAALFRWTCSPTCYGVFGSATFCLLVRESPAIMVPSSPGVDSSFAYEWVDNHTIVEPESGDRFSWRNRPFRLAMPPFLGPTAANEDKFPNG
ncbi:hypothetical protein PF010_g11849 [Phytophthora fragariae]|uniref:Uncharacterized protein n=1 Tax=Phytophthora fragariae TaxID=53985 RepID=A0A6A3UAA6_9STRA|nr:hypothetical protein PF010_g11849 [Phytophthora fragariae]KAE9143903.1 hypothetical protein PF006_g11100 [Phytophthora fragariae]